MQKSEDLKPPSERIVMNIRRAIRKQYSAEEKIRSLARSARPDSVRLTKGSILADSTKPEKSNESETSGPLAEVRPF